MNVYTVEKQIVSVVKNRHGKPMGGKEKRWYIFRNGAIITKDHKGYIADASGLYFKTKKEALAEITALNELDKEEERI